MKLFSTIGISCFSLSAVLLTGCALHSTASNPKVSFAVAGTVHGGQSPVSGAHVYLIQQNPDGTPTSVDLIASKNAATGASNPSDSVGYYVPTDSGGNFSLTNNYSCTADYPVYIVALGGNPGLAAGTNNAALAETSYLGICRNAEFPSTVMVDVSETSTVAMVYATGGSLQSLANLGYSGEAQGTFANLVDLASGSVRTVTTGGNGLVPQAKINTLANIITACINSNGATAPVATSGGTYTPPCGMLFGTATSDGTSTGTQPTNTVDALINILHHPASNVAALFQMSAATAPFQPNLTSAPSDWNLVITYPLTFTYNGVSQPFTPALPAIDGDTVFVAGTEGGAEGIIDFSLNGVIANEDRLLPGSNRPNGNGNITFSNVQQCVPIDQGDCFFAGNTVEDGAVLGELQGSYGPLSGPDAANFTAANYAYTGGGLLGPRFAITLDYYDNVYVADATAKLVAKYNSTYHAPLSGTGYAAGYPWTGVGADFNQNIYLVASSVNQLFVASPSGVLTSTPGVGGGLNQPNSVLPDVFGTVPYSLTQLGVWVTNANNSLSRFTVNTSTLVPTAVSPASGYTGGGLNFDTTAYPIIPLAEDYSGDAWVPNRAGQSITGMTPAGVPITPSTGYSTGCPSKGIAIDAEGDVWVTCDAPANSMLEFIGLTRNYQNPLQ